MELEDKMFYSMTGYGAGQATSKKMEVLCEIKSVNNRFIDISFRGYSLTNDLEEYIKNQIKKKFLRGSFEIKIHDNFQSEHSYELNLQSINNLKKTLKASKDFKHLNLKLSDLRDIPGLLAVQTSKKDISFLGKKAIIEYLPIQPGDVEATFADTSLLESYIGFKPKTKIKDGIKKFIEWYKDFYQIK